MTKQGSGKQRKKAKFYDPPNVLRKKVGTGGIDPVLLERAEAFIEKNDIDITLYAEKMIERLKQVVKAARNVPKAERETIDEISRPIMDLKANGAMFGHGLMSEIAAIMLNFLEELNELNDDAFDIIAVHQKALEAIVHNRLKGQGGPQGGLLIRELVEACARYRKKYMIMLDISE